MADPILKTYGPQAARHFETVAAILAARQISEGGARGNVPPWAGSAELDFHGTLAAIWIWARHQTLTRAPRFAAARQAAWRFIDDAWGDFIPDALGPDASDEAAFDCAMVLRARIAERASPTLSGGETDSASDVARPTQRAASAARLLAAHLAELTDLSGRDFHDPGFLAWNLVEYGRAAKDRGLLSTGRGFVERAFGMKSPAPFADEPESMGGLFDFSSTTATRLLAILASEGNTPFVGAWLRERVAPAIAPAFLFRALDENCWNACAATLLGRAYVISTDPRFLAAYQIICAELARRDPDVDGAICRDLRVAERGADTLATFYYGLATDALLRSEVASPELHVAAGSP